MIEGMRASLVVLLLAGCYAPSPMPGAPCTQAGACPAPLVCTLGTCERAPTDLDGSIDDAPPPDADLTCSCAGDKLVCGGGETACAASCIAGPIAHCGLVVPRNDVTRDSLADVSDAISLGGTITINTDDGAITGGFTRAAGTGVIAGIDFQLQGTLSVFTVAKLTVSGDVRVIGTRPVVFLVGSTVSIGGTLDLSANPMGDRSIPGPGGGRGQRFNMTGGGCGPGLAGSSMTPSDGGGGGGGAGAAGGSGGDSGSAAGGMGGSACLSAQLEPLVGGSAGGGGSPGSAVAPSRGGGGGGALQITALERITIGGAILLNGGGGEGGVGGATSNGGGGGGGGAGGALLLEAPSVSVTGSVIANGGGGGGGAEATTSGFPGADGRADATPAAGGAPATTGPSAGGAGGAGAIAAQSAADTAADFNAGGGGGGVGRILIRSFTSPSLPGTESPAVSTAAIVLE